MNLLMKPLTLTFGGQSPRKKLPQPPPEWQIERNVLSRNELKALLNYVDSNFTLERDLPAGVLADTLYSSAIHNMESMNRGQAPIEFLKPPGILSKVLTRMKRALQKRFNADFTSRISYSLLHYRLPLGKPLPAVRWHNDKSQFLGILTLRQPQVEGGLFQLRSAASGRKKADVDILQMQPKDNTMVVFSDQGTEHSVSEAIPLASNIPERPDMAIRDVLTIQAF